MAGALDQRLGVYEDPSVTNKTVGVTTFKKVSERNVLNNYRSYTYNFTLSAVRRTDVGIPEVYRQKTDLVILKSGGKGSTGLSTEVTAITRKTVTNQVFASEEGDYVVPTVSVEEDTTGADLVKSFNKHSPGRFDMFIDNVEIESSMAFTEIAGPTLFTGIRFDIIEPYSINGFVDALHVASIAAGYPSYMGASFMLKMEFLGYPDNEDIPSAERIPLSDRYFLIAITGFSAELTERGTRYRCTAIPWTEKGYGQPNELKTAISMKGSTVADVLENLATKIEQQIKESDTESKADASGRFHDKYEIKFPVRMADGTLNYDEVNPIGKSLITTIDKGNTLLNFLDQGEVESTTVSYNPQDSEPRIQFREKSKIHEIISAVIRDSEYVRNLLKTIGRTGNPDSDGFVEYFIVTLNVTNLDQIDYARRKPFQKYTYVVTPYKVFYTRIPNYNADKVDTSKINHLVSREYNYIYTGKNLDVLSFKLDFNTLYFEAVGKALGNNDRSASQFATGQTADVSVKQKDRDPIKIKRTEIGTVPQYESADLTRLVREGGNAAQIQDDPYFLMARNMHTAIIDSKNALLTGDIDILGDPFYLAQGGMGNYESKIESPGKTKDGDADRVGREILITIEFNNPVDIKPLEEGGTLMFDENKVPFSGVYRVNTVTSTFQEGIFKQRLKIMRLAGQIIDNTTPDKPENVLITTVKINESTTGGSE